MIRVNRLCRRFGTRTAVRDVSFDVGRSEIVALLGPNGAGKTTTLRMMAGLIAPTSGEVIIDGMPLSRHTAPALKRRIGFLTETPGLWDRLTVRENLSVYAGLYGLPEADAVVDRMLARFDLASHADTSAAELSKGMRQKAAIARALLHEPRVLLLDEPLSGLDPAFARSIRHLLEERRESGCAILMSTHNLDEAERLANRVAVLQERLIALDTSATLRRRLAGARILVRVTGDPTAYVPLLRRFDPAAAADNDVLIVKLRDADRETPDLVRALVAAGANLVEIRPEVPALEDVYLHLVGASTGNTEGSDR